MDCLFSPFVLTIFCTEHRTLKHLNARDTFVGMYAVEYVQQKNRGEWVTEKAIKHACKASARTIERLGAQDSIPWIDEIDE